MQQQHQKQQKQQQRKQQQQEQEIREEGRLRWQRRQSQQGLGGDKAAASSGSSSPSGLAVGSREGDDEKLSMALPRSKGDGRAGAKGGDSHDGGVGGGKGEDVANGAGGGAGGGGGGIGGEGKGGEVGAFLGRGGWEAAAGTGTERGCDEGVGSTGPKAPVSAAPTKFIPKVGGVARRLAYCRDVTHWGGGRGRKGVLGFAASLDFFFFFFVFFFL